MRPAFSSSQHPEQQLPGTCTSGPAKLSPAAGKRLSYRQSVLAPSALATFSLPGRLMRSRLFSFLSCLLLSATAVQSAQAVDLSQQRQYYDEAKRALAKGDSGPYFHYSQALSDYPLEPYLAYDELTARLKTASNDEIERFLAEHGDLPQANWMKRSEE